MLDNEENTRRRALRPQEMSLVDSCREYFATGNIHVLEDEIASHPDPNVAIQLPTIAFYSRDRRLLGLALRFGISFQEDDDMSSESFLCDAIETGGNCPEIIRWLLEHGASPIRRTFNGWTALHLAAIKNLPEVIRVLLDGGADIEVGTVVDGNYSPLMEACRVGATDSVSMLLANGADPAHRDEMVAHSVLDIARKSGNSSVIAMIASAQRQPL